MLPKFSVKDRDRQPDSLVHIDSKKIKGTSHPTDLFSAVSVALFNSQRGSEVLREVCARYIADNWSSMQSVICHLEMDKVLDCDLLEAGKSNPGRVEITAISLLFNCQIDLKTAQNLEERFGEGGKTWIRLLQLQHGEGHKYVSCRLPLLTLPDPPPPPPAAPRRQKKQLTLRQGFIAPHMQGQEVVNPPSYKVASVRHEATTPPGSPPASPTTRRRRLHSRTCPLKDHLSVIDYSTLELFSRNSLLLIFPCLVNRKSVYCLFDPGSEITLMKPHVAVGLAIRPSSGFPGNADSSALMVTGICTADFELGPIAAPFDFVIAPYLSYDVILGMDWVRAFHCASCFDCSKLLVQHNGFKVLLTGREGPKSQLCNAIQELHQLPVDSLYAAHRTLACSEVTVIRPGETLMIPITMSPHPILETSLFTPSAKIADGVEAMECILDAACNMIPVTNHGDVEVCINPGTKLGRVEGENAGMQVRTLDRVAIKNADDAPPPPQVNNIAMNSPIQFDINPKLGPSWQADMRSVLDEYQDIFHRKGQALKCTNIMEAKLELHDTTLYYVPQYRLTPDQLKAANEEITTLLEQGTIREQLSHYCLSLLVVPKATPPGEKQRWRVCCDARPLNRRLKTLTYKGPPASVYLSTLQRKKFFSQFDLKSSYQQIKIHPDSQQYLGFQHQGKSYVYTSLPFGVACAGEFLQIALTQAFAGLLHNGVIFYVDDGTCYSDTFEEHLRLLRACFSRFRKFSFALNPDKCRFGYFDAEALGNIITRCSVSPDTRRLRPLQHLVDVRDKTRAKGVVAYFSFFRNFLRSFAQRANILFDASNPQTKFVWTDQHVAVVKELYQELITSALRHFHEDRPSRLMTDGCHQGIGSCFLQKDPETCKWHPVGNFSRLLTTVERNYCMTAIELLAISASCNYFTKELQTLTSACEVQTDCQAVVYLINSDFLPPPMARLMAHVRMFNVTLKHVKATGNRAADALSRNALPHQITDFDREPLPGEDTQNDNRPPRTPVQPRADPQPVAAAVTRAQAASSETSATSPPTAGPAQPLKPPPAPPDDDSSGSDYESACEDEDNGSNSEFSSDAEEATFKDCGPSGDCIPENIGELQKFQFLDPETGPLIKALQQENSPPSPFFTLIEGVLYHVKDNKHRLYVPSCFRENLLSELHDFGHFGKEKLIAKVSQQYFWPDLRKSCSVLVDSCTLCQRFKRKPVQEGFLQSVSAKAPNHIIFIDFKATPKSTKGNTQVLIHADTFTRFVRLFACKSTATEDATRALRKAFLETGTPKKLVCDEGSAFTSHDFKDFTKNIGCELHIIPANAHQSNGLAEAFAKLAGERIALMCHQRLSHWDESLPEVQLAINDSLSKSLGNTPFFLQYGYHPKHSKLQSLLSPLVPPTTAGEHLQRLWDARYSAQHALKKSQRGQQQRYNANRLRPQYNEGQKVWVYYRQRSTPETPKKYALAWRSGRILHSINPVTYLVKTKHAGKYLVRKVHVNYLKKRT